MENTEAMKKPTSAFNLYIQLYCKKHRGKSKYHSTFVEATKSWLTLNSEEKEMVTKKFNEYTYKMKQSYASSLKNAEPFLKKKRKQAMVVKSSINISQQGGPREITCNTPIQSVVTQDSLCSPIREEQMDSIEVSQDLLKTRHDSSQIYSDQMADSHGINNNTLTPLTNALQLPEPTPPTIKTAKDLYDMVSTFNEGSDINWESLSALKKRRYQSAILGLKKGYINKYKEYLASLPSQDLFDHYCNKNNGCS